MINQAVALVERAFTATKFVASCARTDALVTFNVDDFDAAHKFALPVLAPAAYLQQLNLFFVTASAEKVSTLNTEAFFKERQMSQLHCDTHLIRARPAIGLQKPALRLSDSAANAERKNTTGNTAGAASTTNGAFFACSHCIEDTFHCCLHS